MSKSTEISRFESRFSQPVMEVAAVTGASGIGAGRAGKDIMWTASIKLIAWKTLGADAPVDKEELRLEWLADDEEWQKSRNIMEPNSIVRLQVRRAEKSMMLVKVLETGYRDPDLEIVLQQSMQPVFYHDEMLGEFELDKSVKLFERKLLWAGEEGTLYFDWNEDTPIMMSALETAYALFKDQNEWSAKIKLYAAKQLTGLANDWLQESDETEINEITNEMFIGFMELSSISVYPEGDFEIFYYDGEMFGGHSIIVCGNIDGNLTSAEIAG